MGKILKDEFSALPIPPQRRYQLRARRDHRCVMCASPATTKYYCDLHAKSSADRAKRHRKKNPDKAAARRAVCNAIASGKLKRGICETEGCKKFGHAHHKDYSQPFQITWLCHRHHQETHGKSSFID